MRVDLRSQQGKLRRPGTGKKLRFLLLGHKPVNHELDQEGHGGKGDGVYRFNHNMIEPDLELLIGETTQIYIHHDHDHQPEEDEKDQHPGNGHHVPQYLLGIQQIQRNQSIYRIKVADVHNLRRNRIIVIVFGVFPVGKDQREFRNQRIQDPEREMKK